MAIAKIFRLYVFGPSGLTMALLHYAAKFDPFLSLECGRVEGRGKILPSGNLGNRPRPPTQPRCPRSSMMSSASVLSTASSVDYPELLLGSVRVCCLPLGAAPLKIEEEDRYVGRWIE